MWTSVDRFMFPTHCCVGNIDIVCSKILFSSFWIKRIHTLLPTDFKWAKASAFDSSLPNTVCVLYSNCIFPFTSRVLMASPYKKSLWRFCCVVELLFFFKTLHFFPFVTVCLEHWILLFWIPIKCLLTRHLPGFATSHIKRMSVTELKSSFQHNSCWYIIFHHKYYYRHLSR